jgi:hypothetical protein
MNTVAYFLEINEQILHDSILAGNSIIRSLIFEYAIIKQNAKREAYSNVLSVQRWQ